MIDTIGIERNVIRTLFKAKENGFEPPRPSHINAEKAEMAAITET
jgi:hypothetical protein